VCAPTAAYYQPLFSAAVGSLNGTERDASGRFDGNDIKSGAEPRSTPPTRSLSHSPLCVKVAPRATSKANFGDCPK